MKIVIYAFQINRKCRMKNTKIGNKTANINIKNNNLSTMLTATNQKQQRS